MDMDVKPVCEDWDSMMPSISEDRLLLLEQTHRVGNETAAALAALHLLRNAAGSRARLRLLDGAIARLEGFAAVNRVLSVADAARVDLAVEMQRLCEGISASRREAVESRITLDLGNVEVDGTTARRVLMIVAELVHNALRHALEGRAGSLILVLRREADDVAVSVIDDGPGLGGSTASGSRMGGPITRELVRRAGGCMECDTGPEGTTFYVAIPIGQKDRDRRS